MAKELKLYGLIDEPSPYDTLEIWEQHLKRVEAILPEDDTVRTLDRARRMVAEKRKERAGPAIPTS